MLLSPSSPQSPLSVSFDMTRECPLCKKDARLQDCLRIGKSRLQRLQAQQGTSTEGINRNTWAHRTCAQGLGPLQNAGAVELVHEDTQMGVEAAGLNSSCSSSVSQEPVGQHSVVKAVGADPPQDTEMSDHEKPDVGAADDVSPDDSISIAANSGSTMWLSGLPVVHLNPELGMPTNEINSVRQRVAWHEEYGKRMQALVEQQKTTNEMRLHNANDDGDILSQEAQNLQKRSSVQQQHIAYLQEERERDNLKTKLLQQQLQTEQQQEAMKLKSTTQLLNQQLQEEQLRQRMKVFPDVQQFVATLKASGTKDRAALRLVVERYSWLSSSARIAPKKILEMRYVMDMLVAEEIVSAALCPIVGDGAQQIRASFQRILEGMDD